MSKEQRAREHPTPDAGLWVDKHGDYLYRYAMFRLRDSSLAEDIVQETLLAALQASGSFAGRGSERTWLVGILKHKVMDHFRHISRGYPADKAAEQSFEDDHFFRTSGEWTGHWQPAQAPFEWSADPATLLEQSEFREVFNRCLSFLPSRIASAFTLREVDGLSSEEICEVLGVSVANLWVMLHRARMSLRHCLDLNWFRRERVEP